MKDRFEKKKEFDYLKGKKEKKIIKVDTTLFL
jgi:hypothetical protein